MRIHRVVCESLDRLVEEMLAHGNVYSSLFIIAVIFIPLKARAMAGVGGSTILFSPTIFGTTFPQCPKKEASDRCSRGLLGGI